MSDGGGGRGDLGDGGGALGEHLAMAELAAVKEARDTLFTEKVRQIREHHDMEERYLAALLVLKEVVDGYEARLAALLLEHLAVVLTCWPSR